MNTNYTTLHFFKSFVLLVVAALVAISCEPDDSDAVPAGRPSTADVFIDGFSSGLDYRAFGDSKVSAFQLDDEVSYQNSESAMRFDVPSEGDPEGAYAGGIFFDQTGRDLSSFNVLTFWGKASEAVTVQELGFGLNETETFRTSIQDVPFSTAWDQYYIILPDASKLEDEKGIFYFVDTPDDGKGYSFWIDSLTYGNLGTVGQLMPVYRGGQSEKIPAFIGQVYNPGELGLSFSLPNGVNQPVNASSAYFELVSSSEAATIRTNETTGAKEIAVVNQGEAIITAKLGNAVADGSLTLQISEFVAAPVPERDTANVISIFSDAYENVPVDFYNGFYEPFQTTESADFTIDGNSVLSYINYNFVGIEFNQDVPTIDASEMTNLHADIFIPSDFDPNSTLRINLRDFGADASFDGGDDDVVSVVLTTSTTPALVQGNWITVDLDITGLAGRSNLGQIVFDAETNESPRPSSLLVDNIYLYTEETMGGGEVIPPAIAPAAPTQDAANVVSIYSDAYTDVAKDGFNLYGAAAFEEVDLSGDGVLRYTQADGDGGNFQVIELGGANQIDLVAQGMTHFRFDAWFPQPINESSTFLMKVVDIAAGGNSEAQINVNATSSPAIAQGQWLSFDIPVSELETNGLSGKMNIQQIVVDLLTSGEVYLDNIYFYKEASMSTDPIPPTMAPAAPAQDAANVVSIYSDAYTDVAKDGFNLYGAAAFEEVDLSGDGVLRYTQADADGGNFQVIELGGANQIDLVAQGMTHFRFDAWFPQPLGDTSTFLMKVVNISADGNSEALINVNATSDPPISQGQWLSFDIPVSELETNGLSGKTNIQQIVVDLLTSGEVYLDNIYFYK